MKRCGWFVGHCLHRIEGTEHKIKRTKKKLCSQEDDYIYERFFCRCIDIEATAKCCWCGEIKQVEFSDFDTVRAMNFPTKVEK